MKYLPLKSLLCLAVLISVPASAHHSFAIYDSKSPLPLTGQVKKYNWVNPHSSIELTVTNPDGSTTDWVVEQGPVNMLSRQGWKPDTIKPGDRINVVINPLHSGKPGGLFQSFEFVDEHAVDLSGQGTIIPRTHPDTVEMSTEIARNLNGVWVNASGGIHFDTESTPVRRDQKPPLKPEYMAQWEQRWADADAGLSTTDPTAKCVAPGFPRFLTMVLPGEILQTEKQLNWYAEFGEATIRVFLDGRPVPADLFPSYNGFSTGKWEGNTLVITTVGLRGDTLVDTTGVPHSDQLKVTTRLTKVTPDYFDAAITLEDPVAFTQPWSTTKHYVRAGANEYVQEYACEEGNRYQESAEGRIEPTFR